MPACGIARGGRLPAVGLGLRSPLRRTAAVGRAHLFGSSYGFSVGLIKTSLMNDCGAWVTSIITA